jgi:hypothetical protein
VSAPLVAGSIIDKIPDQFPTQFPTQFPAKFQTRCFTQSNGLPNVTNSQSLILVLWGNGFDELAATIFVAGLRHMGKRVKLVGLNSQHITGHHGLTLVPDLSLEQALRAVKQVQCLIVPAPVAVLQQFSYDPRIAELLDNAIRRNALILVDGRPNNEQLIEQLAPFSDFAGQRLSGKPEQKVSLLEYPPHETLLSFVQTVLSPQI